MHTEHSSWWVRVKSGPVSSLESERTLKLKSFQKLRLVRELKMAPGVLRGPEMDQLWSLRSEDLEGHEAVIQDGKHGGDPGQICDKMFFSGAASVVRGQPSTLKGPGMGHRDSSWGSNGGLKVIRRNPQF